MILYFDLMDGVFYCKLVKQIDEGKKMMSLLLSMLSNALNVLKLNIEFVLIQKKEEIVSVWHHVSLRVACCTANRI